MNIEEMPAGKELDELVAEKVMGWTPPSRELPEGDWFYVCESKRYLKGVDDFEGYINRETKQVVTIEEHHAAFYWTPSFMDTPEAPKPFDFSTSLTYAWQVLNKLKKRGYLVTLKQMVNGWVANVGRIGEAGIIYQSQGRDVEEAICRAALLTVQEEVLADE